MKRVFICIAACFALLAGCAPGGPAAPTPTPTIAPTPTPTPPPAKVLCVADSLEEDVPEYFAAIRAHAELQYWDITIVEAPDGFENALRKTRYDGVIALRTQQRTELRPLTEAAQDGVAVSLVDLYPPAGGDGSPIGSAAYAAYRETDMAALVLETALAYPPHDTPVRMIALLQEEGSPADVAYQEAIVAGRVFSRASFYYADQEESALRAFLADELDDWIEGTIDCYYVETMTAALVALDVLEERGRTDAEVFALPNRNMNEQRKLYRRYVYPMAFGPELALQAEEQVGELAELLGGIQPGVREFSTAVEDMEQTMRATPAP